MSSACLGCLDHQLYESIEIISWLKDFQIFFLEEGDTWMFQEVRKRLIIWL